MKRHAAPFDRASCSRPGDGGGRQVDPGDLESLQGEPHGVIAGPAPEIDCLARRNAAGVDEIDEQPGRRLEIPGNLVERQFAVDTLHLRADVHGTPQCGAIVRPSGQARHTAMASDLIRHTPLVS